MILEEKFELATDEYGLAIITIRGRCTHDEVLAIEAGVTSRYEMVPLPHAVGAIMKTLDGTVPSLTVVTPPTLGRSYTCVKVGGRCNPFAPLQTAGPFAGFRILVYEKIYQQVGGVA